jgi:hypothetical protein
VALLLDANPELTVQEVARQYALADQPGHPDPDVLASLAYLAHQTQRIDTAGRS